jgi:hypothetical protein
MTAPTYFASKKNTGQRKACHMARTMINLPYGKERGRYASDRRGITPTLENAWVESDAAKSGAEELPVCPEVGKGRILRDLSRQLATTHPEDCSRQDQESLWGITEHAFPVAQLRPIVSQALSRSRCLRYLVVYFLTLRLACLASPVRIDEIWQEVAVGGNHYDH